MSQSTVLAANPEVEIANGKKATTNLAHLSNEELLAGIHGLTGQARIVLARLLAYLGEVEERRLDLQSACSSRFDFCLRRLA